MKATPAFMLAAFLASLSVSAAAQTSASCSDRALAADVHACDAAIAAERDAKARSHMLVRRAYAYNEKQKYDEALKDLDLAVRLDPDNAIALHERGYTLNALGDYARGLADLDREAGLRPDTADVYRERAFSRHHLGDLAGAFADRGRVVALDRNAESLLGRAEAAMWVGRFDEAAADMDAAEALARDARDEDVAADVRKLRERMALWTAGPRDAGAAARCDAAQDNSRFDQRDLIGDCTSAFLQASAPADRARFLATRSIAWLIARRDQSSATADNQIAAAVDPGNADWHSNLGFSYLQVRHSWAAVREFDRALAIRQSWMALAGRASARYNLGDKEGAFADAKASVEMQPNEVALIVLGDLSHDRKDDASARLYWMSAYRLGARDDGLTARLRSIGVDHPENEPRQ